MESRLVSCAAMGILLLSPAPVAQQKQGALKEVIEPHENGRVHLRYTVDAGGKRAGEYHEYDEEGTLVLQARYKDDKLQGAFRSFYPNGKRKVWGSYSKGMLVGRYTKFNEKGRKIHLTHYRRGALHGKFETWSDTGQPVVASHYKAGKRHGDHAEYYPDNTPRVLTQYSEGRLHGKHQEFMPAKNRTLVAHYENGKLHGDYKLTIKKRVVVDHTYARGRVIKLDGIILHPVPAKTIHDKILGLAKKPVASEEEAALHYLQAYRYMCGLPYKSMKLDAKFNTLCSAAALVCELNKKIEHDPPKPAGVDPEVFKAGHRGASNSNLARVRSDLLDSLDQYMDDSDPSNIAHVGHRRWCLNANMRRTGFGRSGRFCAMWAMDGADDKPTGPNVFFPPRGYVPVNMFGPHYAWSIMLPRRKTLSKSKVAIRILTLDDGYRKEKGVIPIGHLSVMPKGSCPACVIFRPKGILVKRGVKYWIEVSLNGGLSYSIRYMVEFAAAVDKRGFRTSWQKPKKKKAGTPR